MNCYIGITFVTLLHVTLRCNRHFFSADDALLSPLLPTAAESSLPWKRDYIQPPIPAFSHTAPTEVVHLSEVPSWAANLDYTPESPHVNGHLGQPSPLPPHEPSRASPAPSSGALMDEQITIPPPWRTSPSSEERTDIDSALPSSKKSHCDFDDADAALPWEEKKAAKPPATLPWHAEPASRDPALPWRSPSASNEPEPMISPSASQVWTGPPIPATENGCSHHSDPMSGHHHVTASIYDDLVDHHSLLPLAAQFDQKMALDMALDVHPEDGNLLNKLHRRNPSFIRCKPHCLIERRPSVTLPLELNREEDCRTRIQNWLQSSHPDNLASPPDFTVDVLPTHLSTPLDNETPL